MTMLFIGMIVGMIIGLLIGGFAVAWYAASKEIDRLRRVQREVKLK
ncbi:MAG: hypothetical protein IJ746_01890 [Ruminococcus sp.]|nr:hypothetical protein [Ruminococcus sp.]